MRCWGETESEMHQGHSESQARRRGGEVGGGASPRSLEPDVVQPGGPGTLLPEGLWAPGAVGKPWADWGAVSTGSWHLSGPCGRLQM